MIYSLHIPKTAGTSFRNALSELYGDRLALFYGPRDPATHPLLRVRRTDLASRIRALQDEGVEVLHGHFHVRHVESAIVDPSRQLWTWLRDPIERVVSQYSFMKERPTGWSHDASVKSGELSLAGYARRKRIRNLQSAFVAGVDIKDFAFVGVTEHFELGLSMLFGAEAPTLGRRHNATVRPVEVTPLTRARLHAYNHADIELYAAALRLVIDRLAVMNGVERPARPAVTARGLVRRLIRTVS